jgi:SAM-dependent methyltransferase
MGKKVYDVGFGTGFCLKILLDKHPELYVGLDLSLDMVAYLERTIQEQYPKHNTDIQFIQGDATKEIEHDKGPFDFGIGTFSIYAENYGELLDYLKHCYNSLKKEGTFFLSVLHCDFTYEQSRISVLDEYNHYILPKLSEGEKHKEFSEIEIVLTPPYFANEIRMKERILSQKTLLNAIKEAGFNDVFPLEISIRPGKETLKKLQNALGISLYKILKS